MTEDNYNYRTSQALLRNQFPGKGKLKIPVIPKFEPRPEDFDAFKISGQSTALYDTITPFIDVPLKGGGSAYGGEWKPNPTKPQDQRFLGEPGETKISYTTKGELIETYIGPDKKADYEIHHTDHGFPKYHKVPHEHKVIWDDRGPHLSHEEYSVKQYSGRVKMSAFVPTNSIEQNRFESISDFKWCMKRGGEVQFDWKGVSYCCFGCICPAPGKKPRMAIARAGSAEVNAQTEKWCDTADELLEYMVSGDRLRDVITQITVMSRTV